MKIYRKVRHIKGNQDEGSYHSVRNNESLLYMGFVIPREFVWGLEESKAQTYFCYIRKLVKAGFHIIGIPL